MKQKLELALEYAKTHKKEIAKKAAVAAGAMVAVVAVAVLAKRSQEPEIEYLPEESEVETEEVSEVEAA